MLPIFMTAMALNSRDNNRRQQPQPPRQTILVRPQTISDQELQTRIAQYNLQKLQEEETRNLPINKFKYAIFASQKKNALQIIDFLTDEELQQSLTYLDKINQSTPKNKTRPIIRQAILYKLNTTEPVLK